MSAEGAKHTLVWDVAYRETLLEIEKAVGDSPDSDERQRRIEDVTAWIQSQKPGVDGPLRAAIEQVAQDGTITEEEEKQFLAALASR